MTTSPRSLALIVALALPSLLQGCEKGKEGAATAVGEASAEPTAAQMKEAQNIFGSRCMPCHGATGAGDGPASAALSPKPRSFQDDAWQQSVTDAHIEKVIAQGGPSVGKSPAMPPNPDLAGKPVVRALRQHIRNLNK